MITAGTEFKQAVDFVPQGTSLHAAIGVGKWYIYVLRDPRDQLVRYVGFTGDPKKRLQGHLDTAKRRNGYCQSWIKGLLHDGLKPVMEIIEQGIGDGWAEREQYWIARYRTAGFQLTNLTDGGEGTVGQVFSECRPPKKVNRNLLK